MSYGMSLQLVTAATSFPFTINEVKEHLRVTTNDDDAYIQMLIESVASIAEKFTRRALLTQTWKMYFDSFCSSEIYLPKPPLQSVSHVKYKDSNGILTTISSSDYQVDIVSEPARIVPAPAVYWPTTESARINAVEIQFVCGYARRYDIPAGLRQAMLYHISHMFDIREPVVLGSTATQIPFTIESFYWPFRVLRFF